MIKWDDKYNLGIELIDKQHQTLVAIGNELYELLNDNLGTDNDIYDEMIAIVDKLRNYTVYHFNVEEELLESFHYKDLDAHIAAHNKFVEEIMSTPLSAYDKDSAAQAMKLLKFIIDWIFKHISVVDFQYRDTVLGKK